jgi:hypothetical protein
MKENLELCQILCTSWVTFGLGVVLGMGRIRIALEPDSYNLVLLYNTGVAT